MRIILLLSFYLGLSVYAFAQPYWAKHFDLRNGNDNSVGIISSGEAYYAIIKGLCDYDFLNFCDGIIKVDNFGNEVWKIIL